MYCYLLISVAGLMFQDQDYIEAIYDFLLVIESSMLEARIKNYAVEKALKESPEFIREYT